jgi:hypothetical protein
MLVSPLANISTSQKSGPNDYLIIGKARNKRQEKGPKLNLDTLIDNTIIQELEREGFIKELYPDGSKR